MGNELLKLDNLTFYYPDCPVPALEDINLSIEQGEFVGVTGPAGAGKSTLSYCLTGIIPHYQAGRIGGNVCFAGVAMGQIPAPSLATKIGSVFQDPEAQITSLTVEEEIAFGLENLNVPSGKIDKAITRSLQAVGIEGLRYRSTASLSGGQKQRVVIAAVLAMQPKVLILDEPTSELDPVGTDEIFTVLTKLNREQGITVILFEQKIDQLAPHLDRLIVLNQGRVAADGLPRRVLAAREVASLGIRLPQVAQFALYCQPELQEVPVTLTEGLAFVKQMNRGGRR